jgi:hypothetical protein
MSLPSSTEMVLSDHRANIERGLEVLRTLDNLEYQEE